MVALLLLILGIVLVFLIQESYTEEGVVDEWTPIKPSTLYPQNKTGWAFMVKTEEGNFLELNVTASEGVRVRIGTITGYDEKTKETFWKNPLLFNETGTRFTQRVTIAGTEANYLEIKNEGAKIISISGNVKKIGNVPKTSYPYRGLGTLAALLGVALLIYGVAAGKRKKRSKRRL
jgi:hypothetical protein